MHILNNNFYNVRINEKLIIETIFFMKFIKCKSNFKLTRTAFGGIDEDQSHINNIGFFY